MNSAEEATIRVVAASPALIAARAEAILDLTGGTRVDVQLQSPAETLGLDHEPDVYVYRAEANSSVIDTARIEVIHWYA